MLKIIIGIAGCSIAAAKLLAEAYKKIVPICAYDTPVMEGPWPVTLFKPKPVYRPNGLTVPRDTGSRRTGRVYY